MENPHDTYVTEIECSAHGYLVAWYSDSDGSSGYGEVPVEQFWYGSGSAVVARSKLPPSVTAWVPLLSDQNYVDHATRTGMYDYD